MEAANFRTALAADGLTEAAPTDVAGADSTRGLFTSQDSAGTPVPPPPMPESGVPVPVTPVPVAPPPPAMPEPAAATPAPPPPPPATGAPMAASTTMAAPAEEKTTGGWDVDSYRLRAFGDAVVRARSYLDSVQMKVDRMQGAELTPQLGTSPVGEQLAKKFDDRLNSTDGLRAMLAEAMKRMEKFVASAEKAAKSYEDAEESATETFDNFHFEDDLDEPAPTRPPTESPTESPTEAPDESPDGSTTEPTDEAPTEPPADTESTEPPTEKPPADILPAKG